MNYTVAEYGKVDSTNDLMLRLIRGKEKLQGYKNIWNPLGTNISGNEIKIEEGLVLVSDIQTKGRGRRGRIWESQGENLLFSLLLEPSTSTDRMCILTLVSGLAIRICLKKKYDLETLIKWPNDIVFRGKKLCGILSELYQEKGKTFVILGIGINVNQKEFGESLEYRTDSLCNILEKQIDRIDLLKDFLQEFNKWYSDFHKGGFNDRIVECYNSYMAGIGKDIRIITGDVAVEGKALGVNEKGELLIEDKEHGILTFNGGEVSVEGIYGE